MATMQFDPSRLARQRVAVERWATVSHGKGTFEAVTGFGKTTTAFLAISMLLEKRPNESFDIAIVVPTLFLKEQWEEKIVEWNLDPTRTRFIVVVINTFIKKRIKADILIPDEIHRYSADTFRQMFKVCTYRWILGLTATLPENDERREILTGPAPVFDRVTLDEARKNGWIAPFIIYNYRVKLNDEELRVYRELDSKFGKYFGSFGGSFDLAMKCLKDASMRELHAERMGWEPQVVRINAMNWVRTMQQRTRALHVSGTKISAAAGVIKRFPDSKAIAFNQLILGADLLCEELGPEAGAVHSKVQSRMVDGIQRTQKDVKSAIIDSFKGDGEIRVLSTAKALDQGADFPDISLAVVVSGSSTQIQALQRWGRALRKSDGKTTRIIEIYAEDTQDERWMLKRQEEAPAGSIVEVTSLEEIV